MKKNVVKKLFAFVLGIFLLFPSTVNANFEAEWKYDLDLSDSVSSSISKLEDGVAMMSFQGGASESSTIQKISNSGELVKSIKNDYGFHMASLDGGLLVYGGSDKITKLDKDLNVVWSNSVMNKDFLASAYAIDLDDGFAMVDNDSFGVFSDTGTVILNKVINYGSLYGDDYFASSFGFNKSLNGENIIVSMLLSNSMTGYRRNFDKVGVIVISKELGVVDKYKADLKFADSYLFNDVVETDDGYALSGLRTVFLSKNNKIGNRLMNTSSFDLQYLDKNIYAYTIDFADVNTYNTTLSKYTSNLELVGSGTLVPSLEDTSYGDINTTGLSEIKKRAVFYEADNCVKGVVLNKPITYMNSVDGYNLSQYSLCDLKNEQVDDNSGIINNIIKNPQTDSIVVIISFVIIIILVSGICYFLYKRKDSGK